MTEKEARKLRKADKQARLEAALLSGNRWKPADPNAPKEPWKTIKLTKPVTKVRPEAKPGTGVGKKLPKHERRIARSKSNYRAKVVIHRGEDRRTGEKVELHWHNGRLVYDSRVPFSTEPEKTTLHKEGNPK